MGSVRIALAFALLATVSLGGCFDSLIQQDITRPPDYISDKEFKRWIIEIDYVQGQRPDQGALDALEARMKELVRKDHIQIQLGQTIDGRSTWTNAAIDELAQYQDHETGGDTVVTHVAYVDGEYQSSTVLGLAINWDRIVIFKERIVDGCQLLSTSPCFGNEDTVEEAVLVHEFGHILGLVNRGTPMVNPHEGTGDGGHGHSNNRNSVMYKSVDSTGIFQFDNIPTRFDANDKLDICRAGGKGSC